MSIEKVVIGNATLYRADCREVLPTLPKVDAVITDPVWPNNAIPEFANFDSATLIRDALAAMRAPDRAAFHLGCDSDPRVLAAVTLPFFRVTWLRYARPHYKGRLLYGSDVAYLYGAPPTPRPHNHVIPGEAIKTSSCGRITDHPCERAYQHVVWLVSHWSNPSETVLDPFMGSGTTGVACVHTDRRFIGIEREPKYFDIACRRIDDAQRQGRLIA